MTIFSRSRIALLACMACYGLMAAPAHADMDKIRKAGVLSVAVYDDYAPFSKKGADGIDTDLAAALAQKLGLKLSLLPFPAGENLGDDLRNMVWKGHYLGYGPADVMLHVPVDPMLMNQTPQVTIFAPYHNDSVRLVRNIAAVPQFSGMQSMAGKKIGVEKISISAMVLMGEENGRYREDIKIYGSSVEALEKLKAGEIDGVLASRSEIESVLRDDPRFEMREVSFQRLPRKGWIAGLAVKKDNTELASALNKAMGELFESGEMIRIFAKHGVQVVKP